MKITKVYTKTGDRGTTSLVGGVRISKSSLRLEAYGTVDELNSHLGLLEAIVQSSAEAKDVCQHVSDTLVRVQSDLFVAGAHLATDQSQTPLTPASQLPMDEVEMLEHEIDAMLERLPKNGGFVLPGGGIAASQAHVCRTVCRRAERCVVALSETATVGDEITRFLNRLSDYLFVLAKNLNFIENINEKKWRKPCISE